MKTMNKLLALLLCAVMVFSALPMQAFATETETDSQTTEATEADVSVNEETEDETVSEGGISEPSEETTEAAEETAEVTEEATKASEETTEATEAAEETTEATEEATEATQETVAQVMAASVDELEVQAIAEDSVVKVTEADGTETGYKSLQEAFDYIDGYTDGKGFTVAKGEVGGTYTITLLADCISAVMKTTDSYLGGAVNVTLDLAGHTIQGDGSSSVLNVTIGNKYNPSTFIITDSVGGGMITGGTCGVNFSGVNGTIELAGGKITGNINNSAGTVGGGISATSAGSTVVVSGGEISNNSVTGGSTSVNGYKGSGGGVFAQNFVMTGGIITGNSANDGGGTNGGRGGGVCIYHSGTSTVTISGGLIYGNTASKAGDDIMLQKSGTAKITYTLTDSMEYYVDGYNGTKSNGSSYTDRYSEDNATKWETLSVTAKTVSVGLKVIYVPSYTVTYTDGVEGEEVFADQTATVKEGEATPAFEGTPARPGYIFAGWNPEVAETVTANVTYTAVWNECTEHAWGEAVYDEATLTNTWTCELCGATKSEGVVARIESTGAYYNTLDAALEDVNLMLKAGTSTAETVTLLADTTECVNVSWAAKAVSSITIDLNGHTVTGDGTSSVFYFMKKTNTKSISIVINDSVGTAVVTGGVGYEHSGTVKGGAIFVNASLGGTLTINGGTYTGNTATLGGVVHSVGTNVIINGGTYTNNTAKSGGGIYATNLTINGGVITGNTAYGEVTADSTSKTTAGGGGITVHGSTVHLAINGGQIYGNSAAGWADDILYRHTNNTANSDMTLISAASMGVGADGWYVDGLNGLYGEGRTERYSSSYNEEYTDLSVDKNEAKKLVLGLKAAVKLYTVTYTDGVDGEDVFADQVYGVAMGSATPAFDGTPARNGYTFAGWTPAVAETVTGDVTYTATWTPNAPVQNNVAKDLITVICDTDEDHAPVAGKWYPQNCSTLSEIVWNEELGTWTVDVRVDSIDWYYVHLTLESAYNGIHHELVSANYVDTTLVWDAEQELWVPTETIEAHAACQTVPTAPQHYQLDAYQIKVWGEVDGELKSYTTSIPEGSYVVGEVKGSREEGFTVDVTVTIQDGDAFVTNWLANRAPGENYGYNWDKTPETVTFILKYNGSLAGTLYGHRHASNTNYDWILPTTGNIWGVVGEAYLNKQWTVTYTDGVDGEEIFADQVYNIADEHATPAFQGEPTREGYAFAGWTPAVAETVTADATYTAQWTPYYEVVVYAVTDGNKAEAEKVFAGSALEGEALTKWLETNVKVAQREGYTLDKWYSWDSYGSKLLDTDVLKGNTNVYITYTANTYTVTLNPDGGKLDDTTLDVTYGAAMGELPVPTKDGYTFTGWVDADGKAVTAETVYNLSGNSMITATWQKNAVKNPTSPATGDAGVTMMAVICVLSGALLLFLVSQKERLVR